MSKYDFNADRCKRAIEILSNVVYDHDHPELDEALTTLIWDIEDLHRRAVERDHIIDDCWDAPCHERGYAVYVEQGDLHEILEKYMDTKDVQPLEL